MGHRRRTGVAIAAVAMALALGPALSGTAHAKPAAVGSKRVLDDDVHLNQVQVIGSHNSYHEALQGKEYDLRHQFLGDADQAFMYSDDPLTTQFQSDKVRQIEL